MPLGAKVSFIEPKVNIEVPGAIPSKPKEIVKVDGNEPIVDIMPTPS